MNKYKVVIEYEPSLNFSIGCLYTITITQNDKIIKRLYYHWLKDQKEKVDKLLKNFHNLKYCLLNYKQEFIKYSLKRCIDYRINVIKNDEIEIKFLRR